MNCNRNQPFMKQRMRQMERNLAPAAIVGNRSGWDKEPWTYLPLWHTTLSLISKKNSPIVGFCTQYSRCVINIFLSWVSRSTATSKDPTLVHVPSSPTPPPFLPFLEAHLAHRNPALHPPSVLTSSCQGIQSFDQRNDTDVSYVLGLWYKPYPHIWYLK